MMCEKCPGITEDLRGALSRAGMAAADAARVTVEPSLLEGETPCLYHVRAAGQEAFRVYDFGELVSLTSGGALLRQLLTTVRSILVPKGEPA